MQPRRVTPTPTRPAGDVGSRDARGGADARTPSVARGAGGGETEETRMRWKRKLEEGRRQLPIYASRERLVQELRDRETVIIVGETGSGKTTQIPQYVHVAGLAGGLAVACTQPRRVAAVSVASRVAEETGTELGQLVGYAIRFEDVPARGRSLKFLTDACCSERR